MRPVRSRRRRRMRRYETSVPFAPLVARRLRGSHWSRAKIASLLLLGLLAWALYEFSSSYTFFVYEASIQGNRLLSADAIYAASGIDEHSIFWLDPQEIAANILEAHPYVKHVVVRCQLPNRVIIEVTERLPRLLWQAGGENFWVDDEGVPLPPLDSQPPPLLLIDDEASAADEDGRLKTGIVEGILLISARMPEVTQFRYDRTWGLLFESPYGWQVALGHGERMWYKVNVLVTLQEEILARREHPQLIDLRFSEGMYYR